jgi:hypothetical protein
MTTGLLLVGPVTAALFVLVMTVEGARRPGYDAGYHTGSELELGEGGWVQQANFTLLAAGTAGFAMGIHRALDTLLGAILLGVAAGGLLAAGLLRPDPVRGYPPGASTTGGRALTLHARLHDVTGPLVFLALLAAFVAVAARLDGLWRLYTLATVVVGCVLVAATVRAYRTDSARTGRVQRNLIHVCLLWIAVLGTALSTGAL